ncbi:heat-inducible transcriptional repressor HrcA [Schaalia canis]|uniref:Heat-inducible transcription repressor HrcA n=1 Tax=Schaalia canis TaxID=100469 RepID=A0A3P1SE14_9ACTO|nr:heat-inducible transcriptional repressor HrcA [Schaalia canis]RRC94552.1 heat-inducible transcriptional repressor HrcA [Schaalia canis]
MSKDRKLDVLRAIVSEYVRTREPVGSKAIAAGHDLGVSSATIRNDMALLEDAGLIYQPHTSAGRVPTDKGYRLFVDQLSTLKPMSVPEIRAVEAFLAQSVNLDDIVQGTVRLLAQVTHQVAVVQYPTTISTRLRRVDLVDLTPFRVLVVVITDAGEVDERTIENPAGVDDRTIASLNQRLNTDYRGFTPEQIRAHAQEIISAHDPADQGFVTEVLGAVLDLLSPQVESKLAVAGLSNLARSGVDFRDLVPVLDALEEQVVLLRLFAENATAEKDVHVTIGTENPHDALAETSVITGTYTPGDGPIAHLGVVGPTRMDYPRTMSTVRAVAAYLSRYLNR